MKIEIMNWDVCLHSFVRKVEPDYNRIVSLQKRVKPRLDRARKTEVNDDTISLLVEDYYEIIKELLVCLLLKEGFVSKNHQCLISFFYKNNPDKEMEATIIRQMSHFRNRLLYYGEKVPRKFYEDNINNFENIISLLQSSLS